MAAVANTPVTSTVAPTTSVAAASTSAAAATSSAIANNAASSVAASSSAVGSSAVVAAAASTVGTNSSSSAASASGSSSAIVSSLASSSSSSIASSSASTSASASRSLALASASASAFTETKTGLSGGAIGGIAGGAAGGILLLALIWFLWRRRRDKKDWVPPPPPREMSYNTSTAHRQRAVSNSMLAGGLADNRASSYSTLLAARPSSTYASHSRQPSYYTTYPIATPSSGSHEAGSPPLPGVSSGTSSSESSPPISGINTPYQKPALTPINTSLERDSSGSSDGRPFPRNKSSVDRLRQEAQAGPSRAPSFSSNHERNPSDGGSSRATSPHPSMYGGGAPRHSFSSSLAAPQYPRPYSSYSLNSHQSYNGNQRIGGAPHNQRHNIPLEMPRLLGARPDSTGDFFSGMPRSHESMHWSGSLDGSDRNRRISRPELSDFGPPSPVQPLGPSNLSTSAVRRGNYEERR